MVRAFAMGAAAAVVPLVVGIAAASITYGRRELLKPGLA